MPLEPLGLPVQFVQLGLSISDRQRTSFSRSFAVPVDDGVQLFLARLDPFDLPANLRNPLLRTAHCRKKRGGQARTNGQKRSCF